MKNFFELKIPEYITELLKILQFNSKAISRTAIQMIIFK